MVPLAAFALAANPAVPTIDVPPLRTPPPMDTVLLPVANKPIVSFRLVFRSGSVDDPAGKEGLTTLTSDVMAEGGTKKLSSSELLDALFPMAAELEVHNDKELTAFVGRVHKDNLDRFFQIFTDVLVEPRFDPKELERLRADAVNDVKNHLRGEDDESLGKVALDAVLYEGHPYAHYVGGTVQGLQAITLDDVKAHWKRVFTQDRLVIGLAGAVDEALAKKVKDRLSALPATGAPAVKLTPAPRRTGQALVIKKDAISTAVSMGYAYPLRRGDPDFFEVALALSYLGQHRQSQGVLFNELREKRGMNYGDYAYAEHFQQEGWSTNPRTNVCRTVQDFTIWIRPTEPQNAIFATRGALHFLQRLIDKPIPKGQFDAARGFLSGLTLVWEQTDQRKLGYAIDDRFYGTKGFHESFRQALAAMTPAQVQAAVKRHLKVEDLSFVYVAKDAEGVKKALEKGAPSAMAYPTPKPAEVVDEDKAFTGRRVPVSPASIKVIDAQSFMEK
jgi:zinc protease